MNTKLIAATFAACTLLTTNVQAEVKISTKGGLKVTSGDYKFQVGGRIMYDYNRAEENGVVDEDAFEARRTRLYVKGTVAKDWQFKTQYNTDGSGVEDLYLRYTGFGKGAVVTVGNQQQPFGLELLTSSKDISVLERTAATELFTVGRAEGVVLSGKFDGNQTYAAGLYFDDVDPNDTGEEAGFAARYTIAPLKTDNSLVHLGAAYRDIDDTEALGLEVAAVSGSFHVQAEYFDGDFGDESLSGQYVQVGYILTGETRPYSGGKFKRVKPASQGGAWEVVARYEDGDGDFGDIELGETDATAYTVGVNWYAHNNVRFGLNYTDGEDENSDDEGEEIRLRAQLTF